MKVPTVVGFVWTGWARIELGIGFIAGLDVNVQISLCEGRQRDMPLVVDMT
jgi:hypothetical protein